MAAALKLVWENGKSSPDNEAKKLVLCAEGSGFIRKIGQNPSRLCAVLISNTAKASGMKLENAITFPKRCNFATRPVGYKCGPYTLP